MKSPAQATIIPLTILTIALLLPSAHLCALTPHETTMPIKEKNRSWINGYIEIVTEAAMGMFIGAMIGAVIGTEKKTITETERSIAGGAIAGATVGATSGIVTALTNDAEYKQKIKRLRAEEATKSNTDPPSLPISQTEKVK